MISSAYSARPELASVASGRPGPPLGDITTSLGFESRGTMSIHASAGVALGGHTFNGSHYRFIGKTLKSMSFRFR
jgi:hypothetical protein